MDGDMDIEDEYEQDDIMSNQSNLDAVELLKERLQWYLQ